MVHFCSGMTSGGEGAPSPAIARTPMRADAVRPIIHGVRRMCRSSRVILGDPQSESWCRPSLAVHSPVGHDLRGLILGPDRPGHIAGAAFDRAAVTDVVIAISPVLAADPVDEHPEDGRPRDA